MFDQDSDRVIASRQVAASYGVVKQSEVVRFSTLNNGERATRCEHFLPLDVAHHSYKPQFTTLLCTGQVIVTIQPIYTPFYTPLETWMY